MAYPKLLEVINRLAEEERGRAEREVQAVEGGFEIDWLPRAHPWCALYTEEYMHDPAHQHVHPVTGERTYDYALCKRLNRQADCAGFEPLQSPKVSAQSR